MAVNGRHLLEKRKLAENTCRSIQTKIAEDNRALRVAEFESLSTIKINKKMVKERTNEMRAEVAQSLEKRRQRLADLYNEEMDDWRSEVMSNVETQEDRKARIMERAYALRDARETERQKIVEEKFHQQWRTACDDVRALDSKALTQHMGRERVQQIQDKIARKQQINSEENAVMAEWNRQHEISKQQDDEQKAQAYQKELDMRNRLKDQIYENSIKKDREYHRLEKEAEEELFNIRESMRVEAERMKRRQDDARSRGREIYEYNQQFKVLELEEQRLQKYHDKILLDYAMAREKENDKEDNTKKNAMRQQAIQYAEYLKEQSSREAEENAHIDEILQREQEKVWNARDEELRSRQEAKDYLMKMVDDGRREQIRSKQDQAIREREESHLTARQFLSDARQGVEMEKEEAMRRRQVQLENNERLQDQIAYRRLKEEKERQDAYLEEKRMKHVEREHRQRLGAQGGAIRTNFPLKGGDWYT